MHPFHTWLCAAGSLLVGTVATAQRVTPSTELHDFSAQRIRHQKTLSLSLGGYALANIAAGSIGANHSSGEMRYFHRMNVYWNVFNLGIAGAGLLGLRKQNANNETLGEAMWRQKNIKQVLLFNAGLDVAYIAGGAYLRKRGNTHPANANQLHGYGKSIMLQGGFLFAFDLVNYFIFKNRGDKQQIRLVSAGPMGVDVVMPIR